MGNAQSIGTLLTKGIKVYKKIKREKERQERQQHQQQQQQQYQQHQPHQEQQHRPPQQQHHAEGNHHHQIQQEHDDPQYTRLRDLAHQEAEKRNACYQRSQEAYHRGNGAQAKEESNQGHRHDEQMKQYNRQAADLVYAHKNQGRPPTEIDLHGLFVQEAKERVDAALRWCQNNGADHLVIIVGKGLHSPGQIAKLKPAIIELVQKYKVQCTPNKPNPGCLYIEFGKGTGDLSWLDRFTDKLSRNDVCAIIWASPVNHHHNQKANSHSAEAPSNTIDVATLSTSLGEYYEEITDQVMISFSRQLISDPANTHISRSLEQQVQFLHSNLIASIQPLVDSNLPWVISPPEKHSHAKKRSPGKDDDDDDDDEEDSDDDDDDNDDDEGPSSHQKKKKKEPIPIWSIPLKKDLQVLNRRISTQLGKIIHANQTAYNMILQAHTNSPHQITLSRSQPHPWEWLARKLMTIEQTLNTEFNKRIQDVVQCIMEDFLI